MTHWRLWALLGCHLCVAVLTVWARRFWPGGALGPSGEERQLLLSVLYLVALATAIAIIVNVYRLAVWLGHQAPALWAAAVAIPCVGLAVVLVLTKEAATEFERRGLRIIVLGPRLRDIPRTAREQRRPTST